MIINKLKYDNYYEMQANAGFMYKELKEGYIYTRSFGKKYIIDFFIIEPLEDNNYNMIQPEARIYTIDGGWIEYEGYVYGNTTGCTSYGFYPSGKMEDFIIKHFTGILFNYYLKAFNMQTYKNVFLAIDKIHHNIKYDYGPYYSPEAVILQLIENTFIPYKQGITELTKEQIKRILKNMEVKSK